MEAIRRSPFAKRETKRPRRVPCCVTAWTRWNNAEWTNPKFGASLKIPFAPLGPRHGTNSTNQDGRKRQAEKARQYLNKDLLPPLRLRPIANITTQDLGEVVAKIEKRGAHNVAKKARQWLKSIYRYAIAKGWTKDNAAELLNDIAELAPESTNYAHLTPDELHGYCAPLMFTRGHYFTKGAIWLALWTANRPGITRTLRWSELDLDGALWTIEKGREGMKRGYSHLTPLPHQAVAMLRDLHRLTGSFDYVFIGRNDPCKPMSDAAMNKALATMGFKGRQTAHGFRHLVSTSLNERGYQADWVELLICAEC